MPRPVTHGTPTLSQRYIRPRQNSIVRWSLIGAGALFFVVVLLWAIGVQTRTAVAVVASPGTVAASHNKIDARCDQCHKPAKAASDLRCERCHDPIDTRWFENDAHALVNGQNPWHALKQTPVACGTCHEEHRGSSKTLATVDDRRCAACHDFASFGRHPEFAAVRARRGPDEGMDFSHFIHLREITKTGGDRCTSCHVTTTDQIGFEPIDFDKHCARCHIKDGGLTLDGNNPLVSGFVFEDLLLKGAGEPKLSAPDGRRRVTFQGVGHRDAWVLANANRLSRALAAPSLAVERARLVSQQARLDAVVNAAPLSLQADRDLTSWRDDLRRDLASRNAAGAGTGSTADVDREFANLASHIAVADKTLTGVAAAPADGRFVEDRRQEVQALLDAVAARTKGPLADRAADLKKQLAAIVPQRTPSRSVDTAALNELLDDADSALTALASSLRSDEAADVAATHDAARRQLSGTLDQATYDQLKKKLAAGVDSLAASGDASQRARISELRAAVAALPDRASGPTAVDRRRDQLRLLERLETEIALRKERGEETPMYKVGVEKDVARRESARVAERIAQIDAAVAPVAASDLGRAKSALRGVLGICVSCHRLNEDETALRPVALDGPVMPRASYSHKPHRGQQGCETCHNTIQASKAGADVNVPGVATCQSCHKASQAKSTCNECHTYHPRSSAELALAMR